MIRAPLWLIGLLLLAAVGVGVYAYFTTPLPLGLSALIHTPGGSNLPVTPLATQTAASAAARASAGQPLVLGATSVLVQSVQRNRDLTSAGPSGVFTVLDVHVENAGSEPVSPTVANFRLLDDRGRTYAIDAEATRSLNTSAKRRTIFDASVPPGSALDTYLAFDTAAAVNALSLRVMLGYGEVELPR